MRKLVMALMLSIWPGVVWAETIVVAALGDSLTQGFGLVPEDGFVPQLQGWLQQKGVDVALINAGVSGDTTAGGAARVAWTLTPEVDAMIVALGGNDLLRGLDPADSRRNIEAILKIAQAAEVPVLLVGMQAPGNYGPEYKDRFDAIYPELSAQYGTVYAPSFFVGLPGAGADLVALAPYLQGDGIHPNAAGVARIVEGLGPFVMTLVAGLSTGRG